MTWDRQESELRVLQTIIKNTLLPIPQSLKLGAAKRKYSSRTSNYSSLKSSPLSCEMCKHAWLCRSCGEGTKHLVAFWSLCEAEVCAAPAQAVCCLVLAEERWGLYKPSFLCCVTSDFRIGRYANSLDKQTWCQSCIHSKSWYRTWATVASWQIF